MDTRGIAEGMTVRAADGKKLGTVSACGEASFVVEKGLFFPKDFGIRYDQVAEVKEDEVYLRVAELELGDTAGQEPVTATPSSIAVGGTLGGAGLGAAGTPAGAGIGAGLGAIGDAARDERREVREVEEDPARPAARGDATDYPRSDIDDPERR